MFSDSKADVNKIPNLINKMPDVAPEKEAEQHYREGYRLQKGIEGQDNSLEENEAAAIKSFEISLKLGYAQAGLALSSCYFRQLLRLRQQERKAEMMKVAYGEAKSADITWKESQAEKEVKEKIRNYINSYLQTKDASAGDVLAIVFDMNVDPLDFASAIMDDSEIYDWYLQLLINNNTWQSAQYNDANAKVCVGLSIQHVQRLKAIKSFSEAAKSGNGWAWYCLGMLASSAAEKVKAYKKSAELGCKNGQFRLARCYQYGEGVSVDQKLAVEFYNKSAEQYFADAQLFLGISLNEQKKFTEAKKFFYSAAMQGNKFAQEKLANIYENDSDYVRVFYWFHLSAMQNHFPSANKLGLLYKLGLGCERNEKLAFYWHYTAAAHDYLYSLHNLAAAYQLGLGINKDEDRAIAVYQMAAEKGCGRSYYELAKVKLAQAKSITDLAETASFLEKAFEKKVESSQKMLADLYFDMAEYYAVGKIENNVVVPTVWETSKGAAQLWQPNYPLAFEYYRRSAKLGSEDALNKLVVFKKTFDRIKEYKITSVAKKTNTTKAKHKKAAQADALVKAQGKKSLTKEQQELVIVFERLKQQTLEKATDKTIAIVEKEEKITNLDKHQISRFSQVQDLIRQADGHLFNKEVAAAFKLLEQAAEFGHSIAQERLKIMLRNSDVQIAQDQNEAALWEVRLKKQKEIERTVVAEYLSKDDKVEIAEANSTLPAIVIEADIPDVVYLPITIETNRSIAVSEAKQPVLPPVDPVKMQTNKFDLTAEKKIHYSSLLAAEEIPLSIFQRFMEIVSVAKPGEMDGLESMLIEAIKTGIQVSLKASAFLALVQWLRNTPFSPVISDLDFLFAMSEKNYRNKVLSKNLNARKIPLFLKEKHFNDKVEIVSYSSEGIYLLNDILILTSLCIPVTLKNDELVLTLNHQDPHVKRVMLDMSRNPPLVESNWPAEKLARIYRNPGFYLHLFKYYLKFDGAEIGPQLNYILFNNKFHEKYVRDKYCFNIVGFYRELIALVKVGYFFHPKLSGLTEAFIKEICYQLLGSKGLGFYKKAMTILRDNAKNKKMMCELVKELPNYWLLFNLREIFKHYFPHFNVNYWKFLATIYQPNIPQQGLLASVAQLEQMINLYHRIYYENEFFQQLQQQAYFAPRIIPLSMPVFYGINANSFFAGTTAPLQYTPLQYTGYTSMFTAKR